MNASLRKGYFIKVVSAIIWIALNLLVVYGSSKILGDIADTAPWSLVGWQKVALHITGIASALVAALWMYMRHVERRSSIARTVIGPLRPWIIGVLLFFCLFGFVKLHNLSGACVKNLSWTAADWEREYANLAKGLPAEIVPGKDGPVPYFLNRKENKIFLSDEFDAQMSRYLEYRGSGNRAEGLRRTLDAEPLVLIDWLRGSGADYLDSALDRLILWECLIVFSAASLFALFTSRREQFIDTLLGLIFNRKA